MREVRHAVGLRALSSGTTTVAQAPSKTAQASFKQYREKDGRFYFKLVDVKGQVLIQSLGFESPKEAGQTIAQLQSQGADALAALSHLLEPITTEMQAQIIENLRIS